MEAHSKGSSGSGPRTTILVFLAAAAALIIVSIPFGSGDGIAPILWLLACVCLVLAVVHRWRRPKRFLKLLIWSLVGFVVFAVLHNLCYGAAEYFEAVAIVHGLFEILHVGFFLVAVMLCPAGALVGAVGAVVMWIRARKLSQGGPE